MKGMSFEATFEMLCSPPMVTAAIKTVRMTSVATRGKAKVIAMLSTIALTCGNVPMPRKATRMQAMEKKTASGFHFSPRPLRM